MVLYDHVLYREKMCVGWNEVAGDYHIITVPFLAQYLPKLIETADLFPDFKVLDVGCGTGLAALAASEHVKPSGRILATDFSEEMLNVVRATIGSEGIDNIDVYAMPAEKLDIDSNTFDRVICNFGLTFFQDPEKALKEMYRVLKPDGKICLCTWADRNKCLVLGIMDSVLRESIPDLKNSKTPSIFDFGSEYKLKAVMEEFGFKDVRIIKEVHSARYKKAEDYWEKLTRTGPELRETLSNLKPEQVDAIKKRVFEEVEKYREGQKIILPSEALIATGVK